MTLTEIESAALELSEEERWRLIATVGHSFRSTPEERAYYAEAARRCDELLDGRAQGISEGELLCELHARYENNSHDELLVIEATWDEETNRRYQEYLTGKAEVFPAEQVIKELRKRHRAT